jgi:hypothetical protein
MRRVLVASVLVAIIAWPARAAEGGGAPELKPGLCAWDPAEKDPVIVRLGLKPEQKTKIAALYKEYLAKRGEIKEKYREVRMAMLRRGMYRDFSELDTKYRPKFEALLNPAQKTKLTAGRAVVEKYEVEASKTRDVLDRETIAEKRGVLEKRLKALSEAMKGELDRRVGKAE